MGASQVGLTVGIASGIHIGTPPAYQLSAQTPRENLGNVLRSHTNLVFQRGYCTTCNLLRFVQHQHLLLEASQERHTPKWRQKWEFCYTFCGFALDFRRVVSQWCMRQPITPLAEWQGPSDTSVAKQCFPQFYKTSEAKNHSIKINIMVATGICTATGRHACL